MNIQRIKNFRFSNICNDTRLGLASIAVVSILGVNSSASALTLKGYPIPTLNKQDIVTPILIAPKRAVYTSKFTCGIWEHGKTFAQVNQGIGAGPPLPLEHSKPLFLPQMQHYYHDFQPGSYSTALNIFNPTFRDLSVNVLVSSESISSPQTVVSVNVPSLNTVRVGCSDIERLLPADLKGALVEGFFYISRFANDISVQAVYTFTTIAAFQEFRGGFVDDLGVIPGELLEYYPAYAGAGAGAGGLGLGGSVDIETIQPMMIGN